MIFSYSESLVPEFFGVQKKIKNCQENWYFPESEHMIYLPLPLGKG